MLVPVQYVTYGRNLSATVQRAITIANGMDPVRYHAKFKVTSLFLIQSFQPFPPFFLLPLPITIPLPLPPPSNPSLFPSTSPLSLSACFYVQLFQALTPSIRITLTGSITFTAGNKFTLASDSSTLLNQFREYVQDFQTDQHRDSIMLLTYAPSVSCCL